MGAWQAEICRGQRTDMQSAEMSGRCLADSVAGLRKLAHALEESTC